MWIFLYDLYARVGPPVLLDEAAQYDLLGPASQFIAYVGLVFSDGLLVHWQCRTTVYCMLCTGSLFTYWVFLAVKLPILGPRLLGNVKRTGYNRQGEIRPLLSRPAAFAKWQQEAGTREILEIDAIQSIAQCSSALFGRRTEAGVKGTQQPQASRPKTA